MDVTVSCASRPHPGETECGDQTGYWIQSRRLVLALADGLGHGASAAHAARLAINTVGRNTHYSCDEIFEACNEELSGTRGTALTVAIVDLAMNTLEVGSVGNIRNRLLRPVRSFHFGSARGIVGAGYRTLSPETVALQQGDVVVLFSDGLDELVNLRHCLPADATADTVRHSAGELLRNFASDGDDASVLVYQHASEPTGERPA